MSNVDEKLQALVLEAQQYPPQSRERNKRLDRIIQVISPPNVLYYLPCPYFLQGRSRDIREVAFQYVCFYIYKHLDKYDPKKSKFRTFFNSLLSKRFPDFIKEELIHSKIPSSKIFSYDELVRRGWDMIDKSDDSDRLEQLLQRIKKHNICLKDRCYCYNPKVNMELFICRTWEGYSFKEIAEEVGFYVTDQKDLNNLRRWYNRELKKLSSLFEKDPD